VAPLADRILKRSSHLYVAAAANDRYAGAGHDARFESKARYRYKTRPVHSTQSSPLRQSAPKPKIL